MPLYPVVVSGWIQARYGTYRGLLVEVILCGIESAGEIELTHVVLPLGETWVLSREVTQVHWVTIP